MTLARLLPALLLLLAGACSEDAPPAFVAVPGGSFLMGSAADDPAADPSEFPQRRIALSPFHLAALPVTRGDYAAFIEATGYETAGGCWTLTDEGWRQDETAGWDAPGFRQDASHPAVCVSWQDAQAYIAWASERDGRNYRLPSEAEWEYAARGGMSGLNGWGDDERRACDFANVNDLTAKNKTAKAAELCDDGFLYTSPAGHFLANGFGLYDMQGNTWEWTGDCWAETLSALPEDGAARQEEGCTLRTRRGSSWTDSPGPVRLAARQGDAASLRTSFTGFRLAFDREDQDIAP
ncbi:formylglycine-generating enzyme family protein [Tepidicaulis sp. LMO-SS28]|uniref:formylglycine-generating enzyme family protein n=1 Tax=Tepidicaulis sp. LMO-SS28 TaxID=3447455 RepID=UPI003EDEF2DD